MSWTRRETLVGATAGIVTPWTVYADDPALGPGAMFGYASQELGTDGLAETGKDLRFPMCSSFKWLLAACVLSRVDAGAERLERRVAINAEDLQEYAPAAKAALARAGGARGEMTIDALCDSAVTLSDNTAANLLLTSVGGPAALTAWLRAHGDRVTRLDRIEPAMNYVAVGDPRDTTTPAAMIGDLDRILFGKVLMEQSRKRLLQWMFECKTGETRVKAGLEPGWRIAQKTGTLNYRPGVRGASGDVGVLFSPTGKIVLFAVYTAGSTRPQADVDAWFAGIGHGMTITPPSTGGPAHPRPITGE